MFLRHNTAVDLVARAETDGLVERAVDATDHRKATLSLTATGRRGMVRLVEAHLHELEASGPELIRALDTLIGEAQVAVKQRSEAR
jgi:DNA-binding MarR family transcriptional regulator